MPRLQEHNPAAATMATGLHDWFAAGGEFVELSGQAKELLDEVYACGAVLTGRRTAELMDHLRW
jgi:hypothetical protein